MNAAGPDLVSVPLDVLLDLQARARACATTLRENKAPNTAAVIGALDDLSKKVDSVLPESEPCTDPCCALDEVDEWAGEPTVASDWDDEPVTEPTEPEPDAATPTDVESVDAIQPLDGLSVLITGNLPTLGRPQAQEIVTALGGKPVASVSAATGLVILGDGAGLSKMEKIRSFNHLVMSGEDFEDLVEGRVSWTSPVGIPCRDWEAAQDQAAGIEPDEPVDTTPIAERHLLGVVGLGMRGTGFDKYAHYRSLCIRCGTQREGTHDDVSTPCPNDPRTHRDDSEAA